MRNYDFNKIDKLLQPLMAMMQEEFPNNCKLIIEPYFSRIVYNHDEMIFQSDEIKKNFTYKIPISENAKEFSKTINDVFRKDAVTHTDCIGKEIKTPNKQDVEITPIDK
jgi:hypothetical protein